MAKKEKKILPTKTVHEMNGIWAKADGFKVAEGEGGQLKKKKNLRVPGVRTSVSKDTEKQNKIPQQN